MRRAAPFLIFLALMTAAAGTAVAAATVEASSVYRGRTAQGIAIRLGAQKDSARWFRYRARMSCNDGSSFLDDYFSDDVTVRNDRFSVSYTSHAGAVSTKVTGLLSGERATGTIRIIERYSEDAVDGVTPLAANGAIICDSKSVRWSAKA